MVLSSDGKEVHRECVTYRQETQIGQLYGNLINEEIKNMEMFVKDLKRE